MIFEENKSRRKPSLKFSILNNDVVDVPSDVLLLKHADGFFGVDLIVARQLIASNICTEEQLSLKPGEYIIINCRSAIYPKRVLVIGTKPLNLFGYSEMKVFAELTIDILAEQTFELRRLTTTIHGSGYGLDSEESLSQLVNGFREGIIKHPSFLLDEIVFVELEPKRAEILTSALEKLFPDEVVLPKLSLSLFDNSSEISTDNNLQNRILSPDNKMLDSSATLEKRHVFVAMPFSEEFEDIYFYGIYNAVRNCGLICEKTSESAYTGDILQRIKERISTADYVIADLSDGRPNVYLEVGYAWGKGIPVIFIAKNGESLHFDVSRHRCIYYKNIRQLSSDLEKLLKGLLNQ